MKPLHDIILFELAEEDQVIILTDKPQSPRGRVIAVGDKVTELKEGDVFLYHGRMSTEWEDKFLCRESDVAARVDV